MTDRSDSWWGAARADLGSRRGLAALGVVGLLAWMAFQWGFGNDVVLTTIAANVYDGVEDGDTWGRGALAVVASAAAAAAFWTAAQLVDGVVTLSGLRLLPRLSTRIADWLRRQGWDRPYDRMSWRTRWAIAYVTGVSALCFVDVFSTGRPGLGGRWRMVVTASLLSGGSVFVVVALLATAAVIGLRVPALESATEVFVAVAKNPFTWIALFGGIFAVNAWRSRADRA